MDFSMIFLAVYAGLYVAQAVYGWLKVKYNWKSEFCLEMWMYNIWKKYFWKENKGEINE